jgi:phosphatidylserine/phosphatidylglycerophosphate/cardiolipin synthase-like enzyme
MEPEVGERVADAASIFLAAGNPTQHRVLSRLHAKCIVVDSDILYCGSVNWYRYSLDTSLEIAVRGPVASVTGCAAELDRLWNSGISSDINAEQGRAPSSGNGITREILDPIAARVLAENPKAFLYGRKKRR